MCYTRDDLAANAGDPPIAKDVQRAIKKLASFTDGDMGVIDAVACGTGAIPALRVILFVREPSGLYETRRRAVEALSRLRGDDLLIEFLDTPRHIVDPVEQTGEEAVINAVARALADCTDIRVTPLLLRLSERGPLAGVIEALDKRGCVDALPYFVKALAEDFARPAAEAALRNLGSLARSALLGAATLHQPFDRSETVSSKRQRRSALALYAELGSPLTEEWPKVYSLISDDDPEIAAIACELSLATVNEAAKVVPVLRLIDLLPSAGWLLGQKIEDCLVKHFDTARALIAEVLRHDQASMNYDSARARTTRALHRVTTRARSHARRPRR
jgi:hypothetical protein